jgi:hypothetical protein
MLAEWGPDMRRPTTPFGVTTTGVQGHLVADPDRRLVFAAPFAPRQGVGWLRQLDGPPRGSLPGFLGDRL